MFLNRATCALAVLTADSAMKMRDWRAQARPVSRHIDETVGLVMLCFCVQLEQEEGRSQAPRRVSGRFKVQTISPLDE